MIQVTWAAVRVERLSSTVLPAEAVRRRWLLCCNLTVPVATSVRRSFRARSNQHVESHSFRSAHFRL